MRLPAIKLNQTVLSKFEDACKLEWIITNGLGGYASSTVLGLNTRKYHGLLVAAFNPPGYRWNCLLKLDEKIRLGNTTHLLGGNEFLGKTVFPKYLSEFSLAPFPKYTYLVQSIEIQKTILMPQKKNAVIIFYQLLNRSSSDITFQVYPLITWRHIHSVIDRNKNSWEFIQKQKEKEVELLFVTPKGVLKIQSTKGHFNVSGRWIEDIFYQEEALRGESHIDDSYQPGYFEVNVKTNEKRDFGKIVVAERNRDDAEKTLADVFLNLDNVFRQEIRNRQTIFTNFQSPLPIPLPDWIKWLVLAADMMITSNKGARSIIAGYHWFEVWGRDTFISLPGLMLVPHRFEDAQKVFLKFGGHCQKGLLPNFFSDKLSEARYNSVDATLWFVNAILQYLKYTNDFSFVKKHLWQTLKDIIQQHVTGTAFDIALDHDGLLRHGAQLTWMDASIAGKPVTPRAGKAVEIQALWYNALKIMELLANRYAEKSEAQTYFQMAAKTRASFVDKFWNSEKQCLFDVVDEYPDDRSLRPNQIIVAALDFRMLNNAKNHEVVNTVQKTLLTSCGLRTLARDDAKYVGMYTGNRAERDKAYHNGTVWPWLLGPFVTAYLKTKGNSAHHRCYAHKHFLSPLFKQQFFKSGLGVINEIYDGDFPHTPRGCIAQAWSIAEPLRAYVEDIEDIHPKYETDVLGRLR